MPVFDLTILLSDGTKIKPAENLTVYLQGTSENFSFQKQL
jgi:hypothetical protein